jgi:hypothetical protein
MKAVSLGLYQWRGKMSTAGRTRLILGAVRATGLFVIALIAVVLTSEPVIGFGCDDYTITECMPEGDCLIMDAGVECGEQSPGCAGEGWIACGYSNCDSGEVTKICQFELTPD